MDDVVRAAVAKEKEKQRAARAEAGEESDEELELAEAKVYPGLSALDGDKPARAVKGPSGWIYHSTAFGILRPHHFPRKLAIHIIENPIFDPLILITIMCNCTTMAWSSPLDPLDPSLAWKGELLAKLEWIYLYIFTFELTVKMIGYGLVCHPHSYLRDAWCQLDFVVVSLAWLPILFPEAFGNMSAVRSVRALRPLRALKRVPGMPLLIKAIMAAIPKLVHVAALCAFLFLVFGIVGVELYQGTMHYRCALPGARPAKHLRV